jgi:hypothetical protein
MLTKKGKFCGRDEDFKKIFFSKKDKNKNIFFRGFLSVSSEKVD